MDMSSFHPVGRRKISGNQPDFKALLATIVAAQSLLPTARAMTLHGRMARHGGDASPESLHHFLPDSLCAAPFGPAAQARAASFHAGVAGQLLTGAKLI